MSAHTPATLVKFCSAETAKKILSSQQLRWSAPSRFDDPFELNHESQLNFDPHKLLDSAIKAASSMIFAPDDPRGNTPLINAIRRWREEERFHSPEEATDVLRELLSRIVDHRQKTIDQMMTDWRKFTRTLRICSFTAKADNLSAWQYFADHHKGVAIRFHVGEFNMLKKPVQVQYKPNRPEISTLKDELTVILGNGNHVAQDEFREKFSIKPTFCSPEQEWRCMDQIEEQPGATPKDEKDWFEDRRFERSEIDAIYFGAYTPTAAKREIYGLAKEKYSQAKVFQAKATADKYELEFERIAK